MMKSPWKWRKSPDEWGKPKGELLYLKRAPEALYEKWKKTGVLPRNIDREIVEIMHRTHMGVDQDYKNLIKQGTRASMADGWGGSMLATDLQDVLFGTPIPAGRGQPGRHEGRPCQHHRSRPRAGSVRDDRGRWPRAGDGSTTPKKRAPRASSWAASAARPTRFCSATACPWRHLPAAGTGHHHRRLRRHGGGHPVHHAEPGQRGQVLPHQADHHPPHRQDGAGQRGPHRIRRAPRPGRRQKIVKMAIDNFKTAAES
jgi:hypothetical protein